MSRYSKQGNPLPGWLQKLIRCAFGFIVKHSVRYGLLHLWKLSLAFIELDWGRPFEQIIRRVLVDLLLTYRHSILLAAVFILESVYWLVFRHRLFLVNLGRRAHLYFIALHIRRWRLVILCLWQDAQALINVIFKLLKSYEDNGKIVDWVIACGCLYDLICDEAWDWVKCCRLHTWDTQVASPLESSDIPHNLVQLVILELVIDAIGADYNVVECRGGIRYSYHIRYAAYTILNATKTRNFSLCVSKCAAHG